MEEGLYEYFSDIRVPEEALRTGAGAVSAGLKNDHQVAWGTNWQHHFVSQGIQRCTQWADNRCIFLGSGTDFVAYRDRIIFADNLAEISRSRQVMI